jgi:hypothetical protein
VAEYTRTMLAHHFVKALVLTSVLIAALSLGVWFFLGGDAALAVWVGAAIIGLPQAWLATSMFSRIGAQAPTLLGIAKFSLSALLFGVWFAKAPDPQPVAIFMGAIAVLVSSPVFYYLAAKDKVV